MFRDELEGEFVHGFFVTTPHDLPRRRVWLDDLQLRPRWDSLTLS